MAKISHFMKPGFIHIYLLIASSFIFRSPITAQNFPNILFILADDLGYGDLGCYGHPFLKTPNLDRLAEEGIRFTHFYAPSPLCSPSRAGMLTGKSPYRTGIKSWIPQNQDIYLHEADTTLATVLQKQGYQTLLSGKWHLNGGLNNPQHAQPQDHGFDYWMANHAFAIPHHKNPTNFYHNGMALGEIEGYSAQIVVDEAIEWLDQRAPQKPFFAFVSFNEPHSEIASPDRFLNKYKRYTQGPVNLDSLWNRGPGEYYANISHMDHQVGRLLKYLRKHKLEKNTIVFFTSDNGPVTPEWRYWYEINMYGSTGGLRGRKADLFEGGIRVPAILRYPAINPPANPVEIPVHGYDLMPTLCQLANVSPPQDSEIDGVDFSPVLRGGPWDRTGPMFWAFETRENDNPAGYHMALREGDWKLICDSTFERTLLYNLKTDPYEVRELSQRNPNKLNALVKKAQNLYREIQEE